jgi:hypothetical protein
MKSFKEFMLSEKVIKGKGKPKYTPQKATKNTFSIGDLVHLNKPIDGMEWGKVKGFVMPSKSIKNAGAPVAQFAGSKVSAIIVQLKESPYAKMDTGRTVEVEESNLMNVSGSAEERTAINAWSNLA